MNKARTAGLLELDNELYTVLFGYIPVKTDMPGALPALTREELEYILKNWLSARYKEEEFNWLMENVFSLLKLEEPDVIGCASLLVNDIFMFKHGTRLGNKSGLSAIKELEAHYLSGATGHVHKLARYSVRKSKRRFLWLETGCLCDLNPEYMIDPDWEQGLGIITFEKGKLKNAQVYPIVNGVVIYD